jgi:hypothetical protein
MKAFLRQHGAEKKGFAMVSVLALLLGIVSFLLSSGQAHAASWGCENNPVNMNGLTYYACITTAQPCLRVRDLISFAVIGCLPYDTTIYVYGQYTWSTHVAAGSDIWDGIQGRGVISDAYVNTSNFNAPSPPIPSCEIIGGTGWIGGTCS